MKTINNRLDTLELSRIEYCPTPAEIARASALIRSGWTARERRRRRVGAPDDCGEDYPQPWYPPVIDTSGLMVGGVKGDGAS